MNIAFCIGNGPSRAKFKLEQIKAIGPTYGCNQLIETFDLDNTIVVDKTLLIDFIARGINKRTNLYTRNRWKNIVEAENLRFLEDPIKEPRVRWDNEIHWGSGTHALNLAANNGSEIIVMIGYDLFNSSMYSDKTVDPGCWIYQIKKCFDMYPDLQFVQIQSSDWQCPTEWDNDNLSIDTFENLLKLIKEQ